MSQKRHNKTAKIYSNDSSLLAGRNQRLGQDDTEIRAEVERLRTMLIQKDALLAETHHRIKNNFQLVNSFLYLQSKAICDERAVAALQASQSRIQCFVLYHELLSYELDPANFDVVDYFERLVSGLANAYQGSLPHPVHVRLAVTNVSLKINLAVTCGLIINELVTNAYEHAFPADWPKTPGFEGEIAVTLMKIDGDRFMLQVCDNGIGITSNHRAEKSYSLGTALIRGFVEQMGGQAVWERNDTGGANFPMTAPLTVTS